MAGAGNLASDLCMLQFKGGTNKTMVAGLVSASAQATTVATGLSSIDACGVCLAEDPTVDVAQVSVAISAGNLIVDEWQDDLVTGSAQNYTDFHWWAIGTL